jgi:heme/copper-type cytochrome/quinol oxidase subunit 2
MNQGEQKPIGAVFIVVMLTIFILVFWLVSYFLFMYRG